LVAELNLIKDEKIYHKKVVIIIFNQGIFRGSGGINIMMILNIKILNLDKMVVGYKIGK